MKNVAAWLTTALASLGPRPSQKAARPPVAQISAAAPTNERPPPSPIEACKLVLMTSMGYTGTQLMTPAAAPPISEIIGVGNAAASSHIFTAS
eukprot:CAMPEP_0174713698 /NCGR_PEP_ID=MMETSP1094-20130205/14283_1 /TAXON_ID=156173 /ORGANISM="Chrysochromulina brevifilum, Strain UTEX LB 985" /LENGTH=92 /DNA_ID=CAMNT_0015912899 /DNA_START=185 /DNA_END=463 /DNA_ORIENTATION=-